MLREAKTEPWQKKASSSHVVTCGKNYVMYNEFCTDGINVASSEIMCTELCTIHLKTEIHVVPVWMRPRPPCMYIGKTMHFMTFEK